MKEATLLTSFHILHHFESFAGGEPTHADVVLSGGGSGQTVHGGWMAEDLVFGDCGSRRNNSNNWKESR